MGTTCAQTGAGDLTPARRTRDLTLWLSGVIVMIALNAWVLGLDLTGWIPRGSAWTSFFVQALHPSLRSAETGAALHVEAIHALGWTVAFAASGMSLALVLGGALAAFALPGWWRGRSSWVMGFGRAFRGVVRSLATGLRSVHELLWAMLLLSAWGATPLTAVLAISLPYAGTLAKIFLEMTEEANLEAASRLEESGCSRLAIQVWGLWPVVRDDFAAYAFYRFECALRSAAVLGFFGFPTLGYSIALSLENLHYAQLWGQLYLLLLLAAGLEFWSSRMRWHRGWQA